MAQVEFCVRFWHTFIVRHPPKAPPSIYPMIHNKFRGLLSVVSNNTRVNLEFLNTKVAQMLYGFVVMAAFLAAAFPAVEAAAISSSHTTSSANNHVVASESVGKTAVRKGAAPIATILATVNGTTLTTNVSVPVVVNAAAKPALVSTNKIPTLVQSTFLIFARDAGSAYSAFSGLNAYGIPYQLVIVPQTGIILPVLNSSATIGNYGAIIILSEVSYNYGGTLGFQSALNATQLAQLYAYQAAFGIRMVRLDSFPSADSGTTALGGCCATSQEQTISISNATAFLTAGLNVSVLPPMPAVFKRSANIITIDGLL